MLMGFRQYFPWHTEKNPAPTYFREKILAGVGVVCINGDNIDPKGPILKDGFKEKIHTIREGTRWKPGDNRF